RQHEVQAVPRLRLDVRGVRPAGALALERVDPGLRRGRVAAQPAQLRALAEVLAQWPRVRHREHDEDDEQHRRPPGEPGPVERLRRLVGPRCRRRPLRRLRRPNPLPRRTSRPRRGRGSARRCAAGRGRTRRHRDRIYPANRGNAERPAYRAASSSSSSIRSSWLYLATRSLRAGAPVLIWPQLVATARSAIVTSSVSPERWLIMHRYPELWARVTASNVSDRVPIWLTFTSSALAAPLVIPSSRRSGLVTNRSSPTICTRSPSWAVNAIHPSQSSSLNGSSIDTSGYAPTRSA